MTFQAINWKLVRENKPLSDFSEEEKDSEQE